MARESSEAVPVMDNAKSADATTAATAAHATPATDTTDVKTTKKTPAAAPTTTPHGPVGRTLTGPWGASFSGEGTTGLTFERRWTAVLDLAPQKDMYEYACHEGNRAVENILRDARALEKRQ